MKIMAVFDDFSANLKIYYIYLNYEFVYIQ